MIRAALARLWSASPPLTGVGLLRLAALPRRRWVSHVLTGTLVPRGGSGRDTWADAVVTSGRRAARTRRGRKRPGAR
jgi:hypothetical protein